MRLWRDIKLFALVFGIGFLFLFPNFANAASNEQAISGYHCEGAYPVYARHASIDSIGDDIVAVTTQKISFQGSVIYNVQLIRSTDNGVTWGGHLCISKSTTDQWYPDVKMIDIPGEGNGKIVFVVWQETINPINSPSTIYTKAVHFSNFNSAWY